MSMKKRLVGLLVAASVCGFAFVSGSSEVESGFPQPYGLWEKETYPNEFQTEVDLGTKALKRNDVDEGVALLTHAMRTRLHGTDYATPNFELWDDIALAACKRSEWAKAQSLLADYRCAVEKTVHEMSCYVGDDFDTQVPNAALTPQCFKEMCGDVWDRNRGTMGPASSDDPDGIAASLNELKRVDRLLRKCTPPKAVVR
jgi:hypothetical protein